MNFHHYFNQKVIWLTGASSGIGEAMATYLLQHTSAKLILSARNESALKRISETYSSEPNRVFILPFDLSDNFHAEQLVSSIIQKFGTIDILINNGGLSQRAEVLQTSEKTERHLFEVNYFSYIKLTRAVLPLMIQQKYGHIVVMSSITGKFGFYLRSTYGATKHALHGYYEALRLEYEKQGIVVSIVCPGKVKTNVSLNALKGDGNQHGVLDDSHQNAMSADSAAKIILKNIARKKQEIFVGGKEILMVYFKRYCPILFNYLIRKQSPY